MSYFSPHILGILLAALGALFWGASGIAAQYLLDIQQLDPAQLTSLRMTSAGILLLVIAYITPNAHIFFIWKDKKSIPSLIIFGIIGLFSTQFTYFVAIKYSNAAAATVLQYLLPLIIVGWNCLTEKRFPFFKEIICTLLAFIGTFLLVTKGEIGTLSISIEALIWGIISAFAAAIYNLQSRSLIQKYGAASVIGWGLLIGGTTSLPITQPWKFIGILDIYTLSAFLFVVIVGTILSFCFYLSSSKYLSPIEMSIIAAIEPIASVILSILIFNQLFTWTELAGIGLILSAILAVSIY